MNRTTAFLFACFAIALVACSASDNAPAAPVSPVVTLDAQATRLREDFNRVEGAVRLLLLVDPACSACLRGLADVNDALLAQVDAPRLQTFVVHESVIGGKQSDILPAAGLLHNKHVRHYWDPTGNFGREVSESLQLKHGRKTVYAWDVWMIYGDKAVLPSAGTPVPALFMHQLPELRGQPGRPYLDGEVFAAKVRELLGKLPPAEASK